jgi:membrane protein DedA with SNARE-associated domain
VTHHIAQLLHHFGFGVRTLIIGQESMGLPLPGESLLLGTAIYAATTGKLKIQWVIVAAATGAIMGDNFGYLIGRLAGHRLLVRYGRRVGLTEERLLLGRYLFRHHGGKVVFLGRFIVVLRTLAALLAGANEMHWTHFLFWNAAGGITWTCLYGLGAYFAGEAAERISGPAGIALGVLAVIVGVPSVIWVRRHEAALIARAQAEAEAEEARRARDGAWRAGR